jgi:beta-glucosidase
MEKRIKETLSRLSLKQKANLLYGKRFWYIHGSDADESLPDIMVTDGPTGLRKQEGEADMLGLFGSIPATAFPTASCAACSWDDELLYKMGEAMGKECVKENVTVLLGPGVNHKRDPLCGRNFEYLSEDPYLTGKLGASIVKGVQSQGVGTSVKHFAANSREDGRCFSDSMIDERTLREIYLRQFEMIVREANPATIMVAYNKLNGTHCSENKWIMNDVARKEWGFKGLFMTDWGAMRNQAESYINGLDLEMPGTKDSDIDICEAVEKGELSEAIVDERAAKVLELLFKSMEVKPQIPADICKTNYDVAYDVAVESAVLLKNDSILPFDKNDDYCVVGAFAEKPRYQGGGSSNVNPYVLDNFLQYVSNAPYTPGYNIESTEPDEKLIADAVKLAQTHKKVLLFAGLPDVSESEGYDRKKMDMPKSHLKLIEEVCAVNENVVLILSIGAPVTLPFKDKTRGILLLHLAGEANGKATHDLVFGLKNPCGKLAETMPVKYEDTPAYLYYRKHEDYDEYREGIFTGYRYYDTVGEKVNYPFGYGLSYTQFEYSNLIINDQTVSLNVTNTGSREGKEIVQLYIAAKNSKIFRAKKELRGFKKMALAAGESKCVVFSLSDDDFTFYNVKLNKWSVEECEYEILVGASVEDIRQRGKIFMKASCILKSQGS